MRLDIVETRHREKSPNSSLVMGINQFHTPPVVSLIVVREKLVASRTPSPPHLRMRTDNVSRPRIMVV
ncbi:MAG: hypothetical protein KatS3mg107_0978 [Gemmataceae bacterium]|nr:MAG: hypothetical protein KatS3mg107_0978 [Gemmataceae bacterium]